MNPSDTGIKEAALRISQARYGVVFTGAGISVESGIPPFRGPDGLWTRINPQFIELEYFLRYPEKSWHQIKALFYDFMSEAHPNEAHRIIAEWERCGSIQSVITQNIDGLHERAGSQKVYEFHGGTRHLACLECGKKFSKEGIALENLPPACPACGGLLKPDFIFFGEPIDGQVHDGAFEEAKKSDLILVVGTTGEVMPAALLPQTAKKNGAFIIEVNVAPSAYTSGITDLFLRGKASEILTQIKDALPSKS